MLAGSYAGAAADTAVCVVNHFEHTHNTEIIEVALCTVIGTSSNRNFDMVVAGENELLDLLCQLVGIGVCLDAVGVTDTCHYISGADGRITLVICFHIAVTHLYVYIMDILFNLCIDSRNILILNTWYV